MVTRGCTPEAGTLLRHRGAVRALGRRLLGRREVDDVEQEVWLRALTAGRVPCEPGPLRGWLTRVTRNLCSDVLRRRSRLRPHLLSVLAEPVIEDAYAVPEAHDFVAARLPRLPEGLREVVEAFHLRGESYAAIARALGLTEAAVAQRLTRARQRLRRG